MQHAKQCPLAIIKDLLFFLNAFFLKRCLPDMQNLCVVYSAVAPRSFTRAQVLLVLRAVS